MNQAMGQTATFQRLVSRLRWGAPLALLTLLAGGGPALVLARPPADPVVTIVHTGSGGLALLSDADGRQIVLGGSAGRTGATGALDRHRPPWQRRVDLLLVPPPHADHLPGALEALDRRPVGRAGLLGLAARPHAALDAWQARHPAPPVVGRAAIRLGGEAWLRLDSGDDPAGGAALALVERGPARLLLLFGEAAPLAAARLARGDLPPAAAVAALSPGATGLPPALAPPLTIALDGAPAASGDGPRRVVLAPGEAIRITLRPTGLRVQGHLMHDA